MSKFILCALLLASSAPVFAEEGPSPVYAFLKAADEGDTNKMAATMSSKKGVSAASLLKTLEGCYLRRVYQAPDNRILAAWMCSEGKDKSRVVIANVGLADGGVVVSIQMEQKNNRPAPARAGSALAEGDN